LQRSQFERMRDGAGLIIPVHANLGCSWKAFRRKVDAVVLAVASDEIRALWNAIDRAGSDNVRSSSGPLARNLRWEMELAPLRQIWRRDEERSAVGFARDRSGITAGSTAMCVDD
jgi:S-adenosylmethionine-diacylglycerol 3-amino-3-carboxypropyl transferase